MMADERRARRSEAFFGRRRGKPIRPSQIDALQQGLARHCIDIREGAPSRLSDLFTANVESIRLEIGFGGGEHLHHRATTEPATGFIGVEPFVNGMAKMMAVMEKSRSANVRVFDDDATLLLDWLPAASLDGIDLLYPDPWPKKKHWKRRFVGNTNLDRFARVLKPGGKFRFASDIDSYINWTLLHCQAHDAFQWDARDANDWRRPYPGWPGTRYEAKAIREGRKPAYLTFTRA